LSGHTKRNKQPKSRPENEREYTGTGKKENQVSPCSAARKKHRGTVQKSFGLEKKCPWVKFPYPLNPPRGVKNEPMTGNPLGVLKKKKTKLLGVFEGKRQGSCPLFNERSEKNPEVRKEFFGVVFSHGCALFSKGGRVRWGGGRPTVERKKFHVFFCHQNGSGCRRNGWGSTAPGWKGPGKNRSKGGNPPVRKRSAF